MVLTIERAEPYSCRGGQYHRLEIHGCKKPTSSPRLGTRRILTRANVQLDQGPDEVAFDDRNKLCGGRLRPLAVATATRVELLPDIPTVGDFLPGFEARAWAAIGAPKNTPDHIVEVLNKAINAALADLKIKARVVDLGATPLS